MRAASVYGADAIPLVQPSRARIGTIHNMALTPYALVYILPTHELDGHLRAGIREGV